MLAIYDHLGPCLPLGNRDNAPMPSERDKTKRWHFPATSWRVAPGTTAAITGGISGGLVSSSVFVSHSAVENCATFIVGMGVGGVFAAIPSGFIRDEEVSPRWAVMAAGLFGAVVGLVVPYAIVALSVM